MTKSTLTPREIYAQYESLLAVEATYAWTPTDRTQDDGDLSLGATARDNASIGVRYLMPAAKPTGDNVIVCEDSKNLVKYIQVLDANPALWLAVDGSENTLVLIGDADLLSHLSLAGIADDTLAAPELTPGVKYSLAEVGPMLTGQEQAECELRIWLESVAETLRYPYAVDSIVCVETSEKAQQAYPHLILAAAPSGEFAFTIFLALAGAESKQFRRDVDCDSLRRIVVHRVVGKLVKKIVLYVKSC